MEAFEMWYWRRKETISWTEYVRNEEMLQRNKEEGNILQKFKEGRLTGLATSCLGTAF